MTETVERDEVAALVGTENARLADALAGIDDAAWARPSLCDGWTVRDVVVHLLMAYRLSIPRFLLGMAFTGFDFDRFAHGWAADDTRSPDRALADLRATATERFGVPGAPPQAPVSHLVVHTQDVARPLGLTLDPAPRAAQLTLDQLTGDRFAQLPDEARAGLTWVATDVDWRSGEGPEVRGRAADLVSVLGGRPAALDDLGGPGADEARRRIGPGAS